MSASRVLGLISGVLGAVGAWLLYRYSFTLETFPAYYNHEMVVAQRERNKKRRRFQRIGFALVSTGFVFQIFSQLVP